MAPIVHAGEGNVRKIAKHGEFRQRKKKQHKDTSFGIAEKEKHLLMKEYRKFLKKEKTSTNNKEQQECTESSIKSLNRKLKMTALQRAQEEFKRIQAEREEKRNEQERIRAERKAAIEKYHQIKAEKLKKLRKKTRKGQPIMKGRIELLLEKIQREMAS